MGYILGLILLMGAIFSVTTGVNFTDGLLGNATDKVKEFSFPKSQKEIAIDNLETQHSQLDKFFSSTAPSLIESDDISTQDKEILEQAVETFQESKNTVEEIKKSEKNKKGVTKALIEKVFKLNKEPAGPTHIPDNCSVVCEE